VANRLGRVCCLLAAALLWARCETREPPRGAGRPAANVAFILPIDSDPATLNFVTGTDVWQSLVARFVADSLVDDGERLEPVPRLASSWEFSEDRKVLTFHLRQAVRWHDGHPFTARDVLFTYAKLRDPATHARADFLQDVAEVTAPDDLTLRVVYREPTVLALDAWKFPILAEHLFSRGDFLASPVHQSPVGTGPFRFDSWKHGREIVLSANRDYFLGPPRLDRIILKIIPSRATQFQALLTGEIDWSSIPPEEWDTRKSQAEFRRRYHLFEYPALYLYYIAWNEKTPFFADARVRNAMTLSLDRAGYVRKAYRGAGTVAVTTFHPRQFGFDPGLLPLPYDPERAAALLDAAGWGRDPGGGPRRRAGKRFRFELLIFQGNPVQEQIAALLQESLSRLGVEMEIRALDFPALLDRLQRHDFEAAFSGWSLTPDPDPTPFFHSDPALGPSNYVAYSDAEIDRLLVDGRHAFDPAKRRAIYRRVQEILGRDQPYTFLFFPIQRLALDSRFRGARATAAGSPLRAFPGILSWYVPAEPGKSGAQP
jgi:peptide/nickel transport system substrate-binding protein